jgi:hypothetical protein
MNATQQVAAVRPRKLSDNERSALENICLVAAEKFSEYSAQWTAQKAASERLQAAELEGGTQGSLRTNADGQTVVDLTPTPAACQVFAEKFATMSKESRELAELFSHNTCHEILLLPTPQDEDAPPQRVIEYSVDFEACEITAYTEHNHATRYDL